ncbi:MAG TPA: hypothetical protein VJX67_07565 [Blastocatellia bacterium]|nr:hypothetical protein [Blastocatellia bacterium]
MTASLTGTGLFGPPIRTLVYLNRAINTRESQATASGLWVGVDGKLYAQVFWSGAVAMEPGDRGCKPHRRLNIADS